MNVRKIAATAATTAMFLAPMITASSAWATDADGPHASATRHPAPTTSTTVGDTHIISYDFGNTDIGAKKGQFVAPIRGTLVTPAHPHGQTKLIIISHLRTAGCADGTFAYPCSSKERRLDQGMTYLGEALAKQGYTVLIPDLAPVWIGSTLTDPYNQTAAWLKVVGAARDALASDNAGKTTRFGPGLAGTIDMSQAGLFVHSRSGFLAEPAIEAWAKGPTKITSVLAYGPAYNVPDANNNVTPAISPTVPYLGLVGDQDNDVPFNADLWLGDHIEQKRTAPAIVATVPGLGHDAINTTLSSAGVDDRLNCTPSTCASPAAHRSFLTNVASDYFNATLKSTNTTLPLRANDVFPVKIGGESAQWMAITNSPKRVILFNADDAKASMKLSTGSTMKLCRFYDPQDPTPYPDACPGTDNGTVMMVGHGSQITLKNGGSMTFATHVNHLKSVDVQITPYGDRSDNAKSSPLTLTVTTADGHTHDVALPASASDALLNRATANSNGTYVLHTMRVPMPTNLMSQTITGIRLTAPHGGSYMVRGVEVVGDVVSVDTGSHASNPTTSSHPSTPTPARPGTTGGVSTAVAQPVKPAVTAKPHHNTGPIVQTDHHSNGDSSLAWAAGALLTGGVILAGYKRSTAARTR